MSVNEPMSPDSAFGGTDSDFGSAIARKRKIKETKKRQKSAGILPAQPVASSTNLTNTETGGGDSVNLDFLDEEMAKKNRKRQQNKESA